MLPAGRNRLDIFAVCPGGRALGQRGDSDVFDRRIRTLQETLLVLRIGMTRNPDGQLLAASHTVGGTYRRPPDRRGIRQQILPEETRERDAANGSPASGPEVVHRRRMSLPTRVARVG